MYTIFSKRLQMKPTFNDLVETFAILRGPNGCPWDKKQTHETLIKCLQNEAQELIDAINNKFNSIYIQAKEKRVTK